MYAAAKQIEMEHGSRLAKIQSELQALHVKQKQLAEVLFLFFFPLGRDNISWANSWAHSKKESASCLRHF